jgi:diadenosine tetraphosphatase ApaH/serine/threonine PP2A family protein phosphatase
MRIALLADIHANRPALEACLGHARASQADQFIFLGDYVGYGADPVWAVDTVMEMVARGAFAILGNHDLAVSEKRETMTADAEVAMSWTRGQLGSEARSFLASLPLRLEADSRLYVHANAHSFRPWQYVTDTDSAKRSLEGCRAQMVCCGHVHMPALYVITATGQVVAFRPVPGVPIPLPRHRRWLAVLGAVGQPRDGDPAAAYAILDTARPEITFLRVPYDTAAAAARIQSAGLPETLATRLLKGR